MSQEPHLHGAKVGVSRVKMAASFDIMGGAAHIPLLYSYFLSSTCGAVAAAGIVAQRVASSLLKPYGGILISVSLESVHA